MTKVRLCAVVGCKNQWKPQKGVTYHNSPKDSRQRQAWQTALRKRTIQPFAVCSKHFNKQDFEPNSMVLKPHAVPSLKLSSIDEASTDEEVDKEEEMPCSISDLTMYPNTPDPIETELVKEEGVLNLEACRICLSTQCRLYPIQKLSLTATYELLTGVFQTDPLPMALCATCAVGLCKVKMWRDKSVRAYGILLDLMDRNKLTLTEIQKLDRRELQLSAKLEYWRSEPNHFDKHYVDDESQSDPPIHQPFRQDQYDIDAITDKVKLELEPQLMNSHFGRETDSPERQVSQTDEDFHDDNLAADEHTCSDEELDVPIKLLMQSQTRNKTTAKLTKPSKESKCATSKKGKRKPVSKVSKSMDTKMAKSKKVKSKDGAETQSKAKPKLSLAKAPKTKKLKDTETEKKMEEYFTVTVFKTLEEKLQEVQKRKLNSSYVNAPLKCEFCYQGYLDHETYDVHVQKHTDKYGEFVCEVCQFRCPSKVRLRQHMYFRHSRKFSCRLCRFESHDKYRATLHMRFHEGKTYKCTHCDKVFNHLVNLHNHLRAKHPSDNVCPLCGYSFLGARGLATHLTLIHGHQRQQVGEDAPLCVECDIRFATDDALQMHLKVSSKHGKIEENLKKRNYHALHRSLVSKSSKPRREREAKPIVRERGGIRLEKRPIRLTTFEDPVPCEKCGVSIRSPSEYHHHFMRAHRHEKRAWFPTDSHPHLCELCGKMLRNNALKDHMLEHTEGITFKCDTCGKKFSKRFNMRLHSRVHLGERYPCTVCGKLFNHMGNRDRHVKYVHTESKDFKCEFCGKCFKNDGARKLHTNHVHLRKPYPKRNRNRDASRAGERREKGMDGVEGEQVSFRSECSELWE